MDLLNYVLLGGSRSPGTNTKRGGSIEIPEPFVVKGPATLHLFFTNHILEEHLSVDIEECKKNPRKCSSYTIRKNICHSQGFIPKNESVVKKAEDWEGFMSPISELSLPSKLKEKAGIKKEASKFAFIHPPKGLADALDWKSLSGVLEDFEDNPRLKDGPLTEQVNYQQHYYWYSLCIPDSKDLIVQDAEKPLTMWALASFSVLGGFIYFDESYKILHVNPLSLCEKGANHKVKMGGPFQASTKVVEQMELLGRFQVLPLAQFHEDGFVAKAWVRPTEDSRFGYFLYRKEDGTALKYEVSSKTVVDSKQDVEPLADLIEPPSFDIELLLNQKFVSNPDYFRRIDAKSVSRLISSKDGQIIETENGRNILHEVCSIEPNENDRILIQGLIESSKIEMFSKKDDFGWTPLHYACRFRGNDSEFMKTLLEKTPTKVLHMCDKFGRYPLHLACAGNASTDVINKLISKQHANRPNVVYISTKLLKRLPIHIALQHGAPKGTIEELLNADKEKSTVLQPTHEGRIALHIAIEKKAPEEVIDLLIRADATDTKDSIYTQFDGMLPIHISIWNSHLCAARLLIAEDQDWRMGHFIIGAADNSTYGDRPDSGSTLDSSASNSRPLSARGRSSVNRKLRKDKSSLRPGSGQRALHLSLMSGSFEISKLLLRERWVVLDEQNTVLWRDTNNRTPLCLACMNSADEETIKLLLDLDSLKETVVMLDDLSNSPLHYVCENKYASKNTIKMLLDAEEEYLTKNKNQKRLTRKRNKYGMTPLYLAVQADIETESLEILLTEERINLKGFDDSTIYELSKRVKSNSILQRCINHSLASRYSCFILLYSLMSKVAAFFVVINTAERLIQWEEEPDGKPATTWVFIFLGVYWLVDVAANSVMSIAQGWRYFSRPTYWLVVAQIIAMAISFISLYTLNGMYGNGYSEQGQGEDHLQRRQWYSLIVTGVLLAINIILTLRSTFLPFAKFAGGLFVILLTLIPFVIVSIIIILCFAYVYRIDYKFHSMHDDTIDGLMGESCLRSFSACALAALQVFFAAEVSTNKPLDIIFGFIVVILLLTIVIAIVNDAWNGVGDEAAQLYWESRVTFLSSIQTIPDALGKITPSLVKQLGGSLIEKIDRTENLYFTQKKNFSWRFNAPYNTVSTKDEYDNPSEYFHPPEARIIRQARSFKSDMYWIRHDSDGNSFQLRLGVLVKIIQWLLQIMFFTLLIILGLITFGFFWPTEFRRSILSYGYGGRGEGDSGVGEDENHESKSNGEDEVGNMLIDIMGFPKEAVAKMDMTVKLAIIRRELQLRLTQVKSRENSLKDEIQTSSASEQKQIEQEVGEESRSARTRQAIDEQRKYGNVGFFR